MIGWLAAGAFGSEGMWLPEQIALRQEQLAAAGIHLSAADLGDPRKLPLAAVVSVGGYCSGSFVSADGLVATNRHCVDELLQHTTTAEDDRVERGFLARSREDEAPGGPAARLYLLESVTDVTAKVNAVVRDTRLPDAERVAAVERLSSSLVERCESGETHRCSVVPLHGGARWSLMRSREIRDVRVVYAPPTSVAYFGGDADNFEWPRHDGDFALLRAYVAPSGKAADPSPKNVPFRPAAFLPVDPTGASPDEPVLVAGFPGQTDRYALLESLAFADRVELPSDLAWTRRRLELAAEIGATSEEHASKLASLVLDLENGRKYGEGLVDGVRASPVLERKEQVISAFLASQPRSVAPAGPGLALAVLQRLETERQGEWAKRTALHRMLDSSLLALAHEAVRWADERTVPDREREPGYQDRDRLDTLAWVEETAATLVLPYDRAVLSAALDTYEALPPSDRLPALDAAMKEAGGREAWLDQLYASPAMASADAVTAWLKAKQSDLEASADPWIRLALALERGALKDLRERERAREGEALRVRGEWVAGLAASMGADASPDANGTLRVTYGRVTGYAPRDGLVATPFTSVRGLVAKDRLPTYAAPPELLAWAAQTPDPALVEPSVGDVPIAFLSDVDTTGGSSGSATLDADGRLVGLVFDGNYESMTADWVFDPALTRSIHVDIRYVLWLLGHQPEASWIVDELVP